jgi:hypothetical protein
MPNLNWRSINPDESPILWPILFVSGWFFGPGFVIGAGRELTLHANTSPLNVLLVVVGILATTLAIGLLINARRAAGIGVDTHPHTDVTK